MNSFVIAALERRTGIKSYVKGLNDLRLEFAVQLTPDKGHALHYGPRGGEAYANLIRDLIGKTHLVELEESTE